MCLAVFMSSCKKDDPKPTPEEEGPSTGTIETKTLTLSAKTYADWFYYSFDKADTVGKGSATPDKGDDAKWKERTDWDIAFHRNNIRTNSGTSGNGKAGILALRTEDFASVKSVPEAEFVVDVVKEEVLMDKFGMPPVYLTSSINEAADNWVTFSHKKAWNLVKKNVFIVRTASGKYVKLQFKNFLDGKDKSGLITLQYTYQKDGSQSFE